jgi:hypothetical protein
MFVPDNGPMISSIQLRPIMWKEPMGTTVLRSQAWLHYRWLVTILTLACLFYGGCDSTRWPQSFSRVPADRTIQEEDIRESVFRFRLEHTNGNGPFFLSIDDKDPSDAFIARFATLNKTVKKASGSYFKKEPSPGWLRDRATGEKVMAFWVRPISWMSLDQVEVRGGMYCGGLCADTGIYRLKKKNGRWTVEDYKVEGEA